MKEVPLENSSLKILVDDEDYENVAQYRWLLEGTGYAYRRGSGSILRVHQLITPFSPDHINRDKLDNRKENLRPATAQQQAMNRGPNKSNSTGYKGVFYREDKRRWRAMISKGGQQYFLGHFLTPERAAFAYNEKAKELFGEFAYINCIPG